jgi:hypothetical protein
MEEGIEMIIDEDGWPVIRKIPDHVGESEEESIGVVSVDDTRAQ